MTPSSLDINPPNTPPATIPDFLCIDLDGTILRSDSLVESLLLLIGSRPWYLLFIPVWLLRGKAAFKREISRRVALNVSTLPVREELLEFLRQQKRNGRKLVLATGADAKVADAMAARLGFFDAVIASDGITNLTGEKKREAIQAFLCGKAFDYVGNSWRDIAIWKAASSSIVVAPTSRLLKTLHQTVIVGGVLSDHQNRWRYLWQSLRPQHWAKNLLALVPIIMAHDITDVAKLMRVMIAFISFSLCASGVYLLNDLLDLEADRLHPTKKHRPLASGDLPLWVGLSLAPFLLTAGLILAAQLPSRLFFGIVISYVGATTFYSIYAKRIPIVDVLFLTALYLFRILGGGAAADVLVSPWLLAFAMFILLSLALTKRYAELRDQNAAEKGQTATSKRGYRAQDAGLLQQFGVTSGYMSVLVLALYVNGSDVARLYRHPQMIWLACPMLLFWISRVWFLANRGKLTEDPVIFAVRDPVSYVLGTLLLLVLVVAS